MSTIACQPEFEGLMRPDPGSAPQTGYVQVSSMSTDRPSRDIGRISSDRRIVRHASRSVGSKVPSACAMRSEEHTSELQSLMRISYAVFCLKKKKNKENNNRQKLRYKHINRSRISKKHDRKPNHQRQNT